MKILFIICILSLILPGKIFTQTEYDYYEKLRLERKEKKIKTISAYETLEDALSKKDYFDENGYLITREFYYTSITNFETTLWKQLNLTNYDKDGTFDVEEKEYSDGTLIVNYIHVNQLPSDFYDVGYGETLVEKVLYLFDNQGLLIEKRSYGDHVYGTGKEYDSEYFHYDEMGKLLKSIQGENITNYFYNDSGSLERESMSYEFQNNERDYEIRYEYEFY